MLVWKIVIRPNPQEPDLAQGYALAATMEEALAMVGHNDANAFPHRDLWPGRADERLCWSNCAIRPMPTAARPS